MLKNSLSAIKGAIILNKATQGKITGGFGNSETTCPSGYYLDPCGKCVRMDQPSEFCGHP